MTRMNVQYLRKFPDHGIAYIQLRRFANGPVLEIHKSEVQTRQC